jgi:hypothetical protein
VLDLSKIEAEKLELNPQTVGQKVKLNGPVPFVDHRFDCRDLPQRGVIHHGTGKASAVMWAPRTFRARVNHYGAHARRAQKRCTISRAGRLCVPKIRFGQM